ncbi:MAG: hypothetical protein NUV97_00680 [archaeon]|nr:hypothetical protein [archaeon]MCR4323344.1 hypothetical protein [Nanoarchaeota archaeon]
MINKKYLLLTIALSLFTIYLSTLTLAEATMSEPSTCCEKTTNGAYCINTNISNCNTNFKTSSTSCETTSYCRLGTCYDSDEGICMENTPQRVCDANNGTWDPRELNQVPQCQLGCCIISDQAAFVPLVRCKKLSTLFGVENNYDTSITSEVQCIAAAQSQDMGACVFEKDFERICEFTTRKDCGAEERVVSVNETIGSNQKVFYKDLLCSAEELNTACARQTSTTCDKGKVYWVDSCGNKENVYSSDKVKSWNNGRVAKPEEVCAPNNGDPSKKNCGNCDYLLGSRCAAWNGFLGIGKPEGSDNYCQRTECVDRNGDPRMNGESWCVYDGEMGAGKDKVGSRYYKEVCVDGTVRVEPCADYREEVCLMGSIETSEGTFGTAGCRPNRYVSCVLQTEKEECLNIDQRDCQWLPSVKGMWVTERIASGNIGSSNTGFSNPTTNTFNNPTASPSLSPITGNAIAGEGGDTKTTTNRGGGICVPNSPPGLNFWSDTRSQQVCGQANAKCAVIYEEGLLGGKKIIDGEECLEESWALAANRICTSFGDCGGYINYNGVYTDKGYKWSIDKEKKKFTPSNVNVISSGFNARVIQELNDQNNFNEVK